MIENKELSEFGRSERKRILIHGMMFVTVGHVPRQEPNSTQWSSQGGILAAFAQYIRRKRLIFQRR